MNNIINDKKADYFLPASIIIAALFIAGAWIYTGGAKNNINANKEKAATNIGVVADNALAVLENVKSIDKNEHIRGSQNAFVKIIEFSDLECPYCKIFHQTMRQILAEYSGKVAWVYRHYPIEQLHSKAKKSAEAAECAAELGGNEKFWNFIDQYFSITPSNDQMDMSKLPEIAAAIGLNRGQFEACLESGKYNQKIENQIKEAVASGAKGTPYSVIFGKNGKKYPVSGAYPYTDVKAIIDEALKE
ncbi:thioredoxin domain-containing protein [Candidatus Wolfebacteria bacterium]|nr:thioredoxin domain-containing protein [Candidatus Wolfebacteria bacterium]